MSELPRDAVFAGHRIMDVAGRGGMGVVYRATQLDLDRTVALKVIASPLLDDTSARERFVREARSAARIDHPNVVPVHYVGEESGTAYIAMRYVAGDDLRSLVRRIGRLQPRRAVRIATQVAAALDAIHAHGIVHRDVKPANILLGPDDHVYVTDFGLAKQTLSVAGTTRPGHWVGTPDYVAPEQIRSERIDARVDVYALGCVAYYMLSGEVPFPRTGDEGRIWAHLSEPPPRPSERVEGLPEGFDTAIAGALAKLPDERFGSAGAFGRALVAALERRPVVVDHAAVGTGGFATAEETVPMLPDGDDSTLTAALPPSPPDGTPTRRRRAPLALGLAALVAVAAIGGALALGGDGDGGETKDPVRPRASSASVTPRVAATIRDMGPRPNGVAVLDGKVWVITYRGTLLRRIDARTNRRLTSIRIGEGAARIAAYKGSIWVALAAGREQLLRIDPQRGRIAGRTPLAGNAVALATGRGAIWVGSLTTTPQDPDVLQRFDARGRALKTIPIAEGISSLAFGGGQLWMANRAANAVSRFDTAAGRVTDRASVRFRPGELAIGGGYLWLSYRNDNAISRIDPRTNRFARIAGPDPPRGATYMTYGRGQLWFGSYDENELIRIDGRTANRVGEPIQVGGINPLAIAISGRSAWVTNQGDDSVSRIDF